jgi:putative addiction module killer protein
MLELREYIDRVGGSPFRIWLDELNAEAAAKVAVAVERLGQGNLSNTKAVGEGVSERKVNFGPGYRVYFGRDGDTLIVLLGGGTKRGQSRDIAAAISRWRDYKNRKAQGEK